MGHSASNVLEVDDTDTDNDTEDTEVNDTDRPTTCYRLWDPECS